MEEDWFLVSLTIMLLATHAPILASSQATGTPDVGGCAALTMTELGSVDSLSQGGLVAEFLERGQEASVSVQVLEYRVLCEAAGGRRGGIARVSVIVRYRCQGAQCPSGRGQGPAEHMQLFLAECEMAASDSTSPQYRLDMTIIEEIECQVCNVTCEEGQRRCVGTDPNQCCNWYLNDTCVATCPAPLVGDSTTYDCGILSPASALASQLAIGCSLLILSLLTFLLGMLGGACAHWRWVRKHPSKERNPDPTYLSMVSNTGITSPVSTKDTASWCNHTPSHTHNNNDEGEVLRNVPSGKTDSTGVGVVSRLSGRHSQLAVVMEVPDGVASPHSGKQEVEGCLYDNILHNEGLLTPGKLKSVYRNVSLKKHFTDSELTFQSKALSCDNLCDSEVKSQKGKYHSLEILNFETQQSHKQTPSQQLPDEQLYEDVDAILPRRGLPKEQLKYDYVSSSFRVDWRGSVEKMCDQGGREGGSKMIVNSGKQSVQSRNAHSSGVKTLSLQEPPRSKDAARVGSPSQSQQGQSAEETPLLMSNNEYEIFELEMEPAKRAKVKPPTPIKPPTLAGKTDQSKVHCHSYSKKAEQDVSGQSEGSMKGYGNIKVQEGDHPGVSSKAAPLPKDGTLMEYGNIASSGPPEKRDRTGVKELPMYEDVRIDCRGKI